MTGVTTTALPTSSRLQAVVGNADGTTVQMRIEDLIVLISSAIGPSFATYAQLAASLNHPAGAIASVWGDTNDELNGVYRKDGAAGSGSWVRQGPLPLSSLSSSIVQDLMARIGAVTAGIRPRGSWSANTGVFPTGAAVGDTWYVSVAGTVDGQSFAVGDRLIALVAGASTTTYTGNWVADRTGAVADQVLAQLPADYGDLISSTSVWPVGSVILTREEGFAYEVVSTGEDLVTAGGAKLRALPGQSGYDIRALGARDDAVGAAGTNAFGAFEKLCARRPCRIRLPRTPGGSGVYLIDGITALTDATGVELVADPGVSIYVKAGTPQTAVRGIAVSRDLRILYGNFNYQRSLAPGLNVRPTELGRPGSPLAGELAVPESINCTTLRHWQLSTWPNGTWSAMTPTSVSADQVIWGVPPAATFVASTYEVVPGDLIQGKLSDYATYLPALVVMTDDGWIVVRQDKTGSANVLINEKKGANQAEVSQQIDVVGQTNYRFVKGALGAIIYDHTSFGIAVNGTVVKRIRTQGNIVAAGWGAGYGAGDQVGLGYPTLHRRKRSVGIKPLRVVCIGDSTGDDAVVVGSQFMWMRQMLSGLCGAQVQSLTNLSKSGETSAQQLARLQAADLAGVDYCLIQIGINDAQTNAGALALAANVQTMITHCRSAGVEPIVGLPTVWYQQADATPYGQISGPTGVQAYAASLYRQVLMRMLAAQKVFCNHGSLEALGAVVASLIPMRDVDWGDQVLYDSIHPGARASQLLGAAWAQAIAAHLTHAQQDGYSTLAPWYFITGLGSTARPRYRVDGATVHWSYFISRAGVGLGDATVIATLPPRLRPTSDVMMPMLNTDAGNATLAGAAGYYRIGADGTVRVYGAHASGTYMSFSGSWAI